MLRKTGCLEEEVRSFKTDLREYLWVKWKEMAKVENKNKPELHFIDRKTVYL